MPGLLASFASLRRHPGMLKLPPYLSALCVIVGVVSLLVLPLDSYSRHTYISENALLPGQVHTYFGGSDQHVFRAYKEELEAAIRTNLSNAEINDRLAAILTSIGLTPARQGFEYETAGRPLGGSAGDGTSATGAAGENLYAILQAPRGDATEALVLVAPWRNVRGETNAYGVALALALARYFRRWSLWSKDIVFLFPPDSLAGPQAWVDAYHDGQDGRGRRGGQRVDALPRKSGALQGAIALDYTMAGEPGDTPATGRPATGSRGGLFSAVHVVYDGVNGQLPNLDLINSVVAIAGGQMGAGVALQEMWRHSDHGGSGGHAPTALARYADRLRTMLRGMLRQGVGAATGAHSVFMAYHVDAVTLQPYVATTVTDDGGLAIAGWQQDEMAMGRVLEGVFRSLNNLLEHLHQSFFFYLLMGRDRFVSIGTYLPSAMLVAANFTIMAISLWVKSGQSKPEPAPATTAKATATAMTEPAETPAAAERDLFLPLGFVAACQALGFVPLYLFNQLPAWLLAPAFVAFAVANAALPFVLSRVLTVAHAPTAQQYQLIQSFSLLLLGMFLSSLATLNFALAFLVGLLACPLSFLEPWPARPAVRWLSLAVAEVFAPPVVFAGGCLIWRLDIGDALRMATFGWDVWGMYTAVVLWCVWWPAWLVGTVVVLGQPAP